MYFYIQQGGILNVGKREAVKMNRWQRVDAEN
jgi:hypothetical protein